MRSVPSIVIIYTAYDEFADVCRLLGGYGVEAGNPMDPFAAPAMPAVNPAYNPSSPAYPAHFQPQPSSQQGSSNNPFDLF
jgi:hypothetical protein